VDISKYLNLPLKEDLKKMGPPPEFKIANPGMKFKPVDRLRQVIHDKVKCEL